MVRLKKDNIEIEIEYHRLDGRPIKAIVHENGTHADLNPELIELRYPIITTPASDLFRKEELMEWFLDTDIENQALLLYYAVLHDDRILEETTYNYRNLDLLNSLASLNDIPSAIPILQIIAEIVDWLGVTETKTQTDPFEEEKARCYRKLERAIVDQIINYGNEEDLTLMIILSTNYLRQLKKL